MELLVRPPGRALLALLELGPLVVVGRGAIVETDRKEVRVPRHVRYNIWEELSELTSSRSSRSLAHSVVTLNQ